MLLRNNTDNLDEWLYALNDTGPLSPREVEVLRLAAAGYRNWQIALVAGIALQTVKNHLQSAYQKLDVSDRHTAIAAAASAGILSPDYQAERRKPWSRHPAA